MLTLPNPTVYPMPTARFGVNPYGEPLYRVVYAPSVKKIVGGTFPDGFTGYRCRPAYRHIGEEWIIEKWVSAWDLTRMTESQYEETYKDRETGLYAAGPYPARGMYYYCETIANPADCNFDKLIMWLEHSKYVNPADNQRALLESLDKAEQDAQKERWAWADDKKRAAGIRAANFGGRVKAQKSHPMEKTASELGLPARGPRIMEERRHVIQP